VFSATHLEELAPPSLVGLLEQRYQDPPGDATETDPEALPLLLDLEEMEEDVHRGGWPKCKKRWL